MDAAELIAKLAELIQQYGNKEVRGGIEETAHIRRVTPLDETGRPTTEKHKVVEFFID